MKPWWALPPLKKTGPPPLTRPFPNVQSSVVVDDDAAVRAAIKPVLEGAGYEVMLTADGQEAVARFGGKQCDLMILDLNLPFLNGWDVLERLTTRYPLVPVIIITGLPDQFQTALAARVKALLACCSWPFKTGRTKYAFD